LVPGNQIHDFNPGVNGGTPFEAGLFWTMPLPPGSVHVDMADKTASLDISHQKIDDYGNVINALTGGKEFTRGSIDVELHWAGGTPATAASSMDKFSGHYLRGGKATLVWSAKEAASTAFPNGFTFQSDPGLADFAQFGTEKTGVFNR
jgi:hypothetical protein